MSKQSQLNWTIEQLEKYGEVSRNTALRNHFSRLSGRILDLKKKGYQIIAEKYGGDYVYKLIK